MLTVTMQTMLMVQSNTSSFHNYKLRQRRTAFMRRKNCKLYLIIGTGTTKIKWIRM